MDVTAQSITANTTLRPMVAADRGRTAIGFRSISSSKDVSFFRFTCFFLLGDIGEYFLAIFELLLICSIRFLYLLHPFDTSYTQSFSALPLAPGRWVMILLGLVSVHNFLYTAHINRSFALARGLQLLAAFPKILNYIVYI